MKKILVFSLFVLVFLNCSDRTVEDFPIDFGYEYFPTTIGQFYVYEVDSIIYDPSEIGTEVLSSQTLVREELIDTTLDNAGATWYVIERSERQNTAEPWAVKLRYRITRDEEKAIRNEDNLSFISMVFPLEEGKEWDGTRFFDETLIVSIAGESIEQYKSWEASIVSLGQAFQMDNTSFPDVVEVALADNENLIERRFSKEVYARDLGLVFREMLILDTQCQVCCNGDFEACEGLDWEEKAEKGFILRQRLIEWN